MAAISPMQKVKVVQACDEVVYNEQGGINVVTTLFTMHNYGRDKRVTKL